MLKHRNSGLGGDLLVIVIKMKADIVDKISIPENVEVELDDGVVKVSSGKNNLERRFVYPMVTITKEGNDIIFASKNATKREKRMINSFKSHIKNMIRGVGSDYVYRLMICSSHFPMNVSVEKDELVIKNFLGEKISRKVKIINGIKVTIEGNIIKINGADKENAGRMAGKIEMLTKIKNRDKRVFQDGCYIFDKAGKLIK